MSEDYPIEAGVPQGSVLGPLLYLIFTADLPTSNQVFLSTFADDTAILSTHPNPQTASMQLKNHLKKVEKWLADWRIRVNENKSAHVTFTLRKQTCATVILNDIPIPQANEVTYLGIHLDRRLTWRKHINAKKTQIKLKSLQLHWLIGPKSRLQLNHKVLLYNAILKPI